MSVMGCCRRRWNSVSDGRDAFVEECEEAFAVRLWVDDVELFEAVVGEDELLVVVDYGRFDALYEACVVRGEEVEEVAEGLGGEGGGEVVVHEVVLVDVGEEVFDDVELVSLFGAP